MPESISTIDTFHVLHDEINGAFKKHVDIAFPPIVIEKEGYEKVYISMVICTMLHEPYFILLTKYNWDIPWGYCVLRLEPRNGSDSQSYIFSREIHRTVYHAFSAGSLLEKLISKNALALHLSFFDRYNKLSKLKFMPYPGSKIIVELGDYSKYVNTNTYDVCYEKILQEKDAQILKQSIQIYEDYIEINRIYTHFLDK